VGTSRLCTDFSEIAAFDEPAAIGRRLAFRAALSGSGVRTDSMPPNVDWKERGDEPSRMCRPRSRAGPVPREVSRRWTASQGRRPPLDRRRAGAPPTSPFRADVLTALIITQRFANSTLRLCRAGCWEFVSSLAPPAKPRSRIPGARHQRRHRGAGARPTFSDAICAANARRLAIQPLYRSGLGEVSRAWNHDPK